LGVYYATVTARPQFEVLGLNKKPQEIEGKKEPMEIWMCVLHLLLSEHHFDVVLKESDSERPLHRDVGHWQVKR
jgi:hypothetical protein